MKKYARFLKRITTNILKRQFFGIVNSFYHQDSRIYFSCVISFILTRRVKLVHPVGVVIGRDITFGKRVVIMQNVTIGTIGLSKVAGPKIGSDVTIYSGAVVVGDITIGDNVIIGANCVVTVDIPSNSVVKAQKVSIGSYHGKI